MCAMNHDALDVSPLRGFPFFTATEDPWLMPWANICRPCGAVDLETVATTVKLQLVKLLAGLGHFEQ